MGKLHDRLHFLDLQMTNLLQQLQQAQEL
jgi:hypothetical protein